MQPDRVVHVKACAICGRNVSADDKVVTLNFDRRPSGWAQTRAHAECLWPFLSSYGQEFLDVDAIASEREANEARRGQALS